MDNISHIIKVVLEESAHCALDNSRERDYVAQRLTKRLVKSSLVQLAALLGGTVETDEDGAAVIYTDILFAESS